MKVAFLGLGRMGTAMAQNVARAGLLRVEASLLQERRSHQDGSERISKVVAQHADELLAQLRDLALREQPGFDLAQLFLGIDVERDQFGEQFEHPDGLGGVQAIWFGIDGAQRSEEFAIGQKNGHRDVALESIEARRGMVPINLVAIDVVDDHRFLREPDFAADRRFQFQLPAGFQTEIDHVQHAAGHPSIRCDPGDGGKTHPGGSAKHVENLWRDGNAADGVEVLGNRVHVERVDI